MNHLLLAIGGTIAVVVILAVLLSYALERAERDSREHYTCDVCGTLNADGWDHVPTGYVLMPACVECGDVKLSFRGQTPSEARQFHA